MGGILSHLLKSLYSSSDEIGKMIIGYAGAAAVAASASGWIPAAGGAISTTLATGFVLAMYYNICKKSNIKLSKSILKALVSVVVAEIAAYFGVIIAAEIALSFIPGLGNLGAALLGALINFAMVYVAGVLFLKMMVDVFNAGKDIDKMSEEELIAAIKASATKETIKEAYEEAKQVHKEVKNDPSYNHNDYTPMDD